MYYETNSFDDMIQYLASLERLGFPYVVQRDEQEVTKSVMGFHKKSVMEPLWKIQMIQYSEESEENGEAEETDLQGRQSEDCEAVGETTGGIEFR